MPKFIKMPYGNGRYHQLPEDKVLLEELAKIGYRRGDTVPSSAFTHRPILKRHMGFRGQLANQTSRRIEDGLAALGFRYDGRKKRDVAADLAAIYPRERVLQALQGEARLLSPLEFVKLHGDIYHYIHNRRRNGTKGPSFEAYINQLHPDLFPVEEGPKSLYEYITKYDLHMDREQLRHRLLARFYAGQDISHALREGDAEERTLFNQVNVLMRESAKQPFFDKKHPGKQKQYTQVVSELIGIPGRIFNRNERGVTKRTGQLAELFTKLLLSWTAAVDPCGESFAQGLDEFLPSPLTSVEPGPTGGVRMVSYDEWGDLVPERGIYPDLRLNQDWAGEVKLSSADLRRSDLEKILADYHHATYTRVWCDGKPAAYLDDLDDPLCPSGLTVILHSAKPLRDTQSFLADHGIEVMPPEAFRSYLEQLVTVIASAVQQGYNGTMQALEEPSMLLDAYDTLIQEPQRIQQAGFAVHSHWLKYVLSHAIDMAGELPPAFLQKHPPARMRRTRTTESLSVPSPDRPSPEEDQYYGGALADADRFIAAAGQEELQGFWNIRHGRQASGSIRRIAYLDLETIDLKGSFSRIGSMPFLSGLAELVPDADDRLARISIYQQLVEQPFEEKRALEWLMGRLQQADLVVTFNGRAFDLDLLEERLYTHRIRPELPPDIDLLPLSRKLYKGKLPNMQLQTLERTQFGIKRKDDIPGDEIGPAYLAYTLQGEEDRMPSILYHNRLDLLTMVALTSRMARKAAAAHP